MTDHQKKFGEELSENQALLLSAIEADDRVLVEKILESGVDPNFVTKYGAFAHSPICLCISEQNMKALDILIRFGANVTRKDREWAYFWNNPEIVNFISKH